MFKKVIKTCPFKHKCNEVVTEEDGSMTLYQCWGWLELQGKDPQSEETINEGRCFMNWIPTLQVETTQRIVGVQKATEQFRDNVDKQNNDFNQKNSALNHILSLAVESKSAALIKKDN